MRSFLNYKNKDDPFTAMALAILLNAKEDAQMWDDFRKDFDISKRNYNALEVALWVGGWLVKHAEVVNLMGITKTELRKFNKFTKEKKSERNNVA